MTVEWYHWPMEATEVFSCHIHYMSLVKDSDQRQDDREKSHNMLMESLLKMDLERRRDEEERRREAEENWKVAEERRAEKRRVAEERRAEERKEERQQIAQMLFQMNQQNAQLAMAFGGLMKQLLEKPEEHSFPCLSVSTCSNSDTSYCFKFELEILKF